MEKITSKRSFACCHWTNTRKKGELISKKEEQTQKKEELTSGK